MNVVALYRLLIPAVKTVRLMACLVVLLACSPLIRAQEVVDTTVEVVEAPLEETTIQPENKVSTSIPSPLLFRAVPDSTVHRFKNEKEFEYANDPEYWDLEHEQELKRKREQEQREQELRAEREEYKKGFWDYFNEIFAGKYLRAAIYVVLISFFLFVIYRIMVVNKLFVFYHSKKAKVTDSGEAVDIEDENLDDKIRKAAQAGEYRQAVRYMYLKTLQLLNDRQWIKYHVDGTNYEYVMQMSKHKLGNDFGFLTRIYDYVWYGEFALTPEQFTLVNNNFSHFYNAVNA
jgi:hypothetical protein